MFKDILRDDLRFAKDYWEKWRHRWQFRGQSLKLGKGVSLRRCRFGRCNTLQDHTTLWESNLDDFSYVAHHSTLLRTQCQKFSCIGPHVLCGTGTHPLHWVSLHPAFYSTQTTQTTFAQKKDTFTESKPVFIGNDVWIGAQSIIADGVHIGNGAVVAANSFVSSDVPAYAIVGGTPAKFIRWRFGAAHIEFLEQFCWWNYNIEWLHQHQSYFSDIEKFVAHFSK
ncbi:MAG: CatB-related O-acetyltransferase [Sphingobacteriales bacterium]|nr:CatB-related O-acetyltransferase [Sphingobacteriales bacterium]